MDNARAPHALPDDALRSLIEQGPLVVFVKDEAGQYLYINPSMERLFGVTSDEVRHRTGEAWLPAALEVARAQDPAVLATGEVVTRLDAIAQADGDVRNWRMVKFPFTGPGGRRLIGGVAIDVTDLQAAQAQLADSERRYRHLVESAQGLICTHDMEGRLLTVNQAALELTGLTREQVLGHNLQDLLSPPSIEVFPQYLEHMARVGTDAGMMYVRATNGRVLAWKYRNVRVDEPGRPSYVLGHAQDVTELREAEEQLRQIAMTDELTGLHNRRGFFVNGARLLQDATAHQRGAALFYVDIDGLKAVNDAYGHAAGSALITSAADVLKNSFRAADVLARLGGDEFVVLAAVEPDDVATVKTRLRWHTDKFNASAGLPYALAMSIGVAEFDPKSDTTLDGLLTEADAAMYRQKRPGGLARGGEPRS